VLQLEESWAYDIDGDGTVERPSNGQQIDTQVGQPQISNP
jgi:hypothetical protein